MARRIHKQIPLKMLKNFEEITKDLQAYETKVVMPLIAKGMNQKIGKENAISGNKICDSMNKSGLLHNYKLNPVRLRKIMGALRLTGKVMYLCSGKNGYYIAGTTLELDDCIESLEQRVAQQQRVIDAMIWQRKQLPAN